MNSKIRKFIATVAIAVTVATPMTTVVNAEITDVQENQISIEQEDKISKEKMDEYRETYILMYGSDEGFSEENIQNNVGFLKELQDGQDGSMSEIQARQIVKKYFNYIKWINRSGEISLSISPTKEFIDTALKKDVYSAAVTESWGIIKRNYSKDKRWKNTESLRLQYICHTQNAKWKTPWNIEPHRTSTNYGVVVAKRCNP
ncbi:DUF2599 domain-containing protein [Metaclostridioides mangenotii]|uniref:DUF2599 domain-containing protein n=1 Tax=Metaclostridioides mangenotii TaxID=1540 RepID=A0ABS4EEL6_9FIRM|nr:DUF2599 domain-containing protein [Clostridioides mangenotii]MBP1856385.1 hypothetical protein [Clostridioides mangenotii]